LRKASLKKSLKKKKRKLRKKDKMRFSSSNSRNAL